MGRVRATGAGTITTESADLSSPARRPADVFVHPQLVLRMSIMDMVDKFEAYGLRLANKRYRSGRAVLVLRRPEDVVAQETPSGHR